MLDNCHLLPIIWPIKGDLPPGGYSGSHSGVPLCPGGAAIKHDAAPPPGLIQLRPALRYRSLRNGPLFPE